MTSINDSEICPDNLGGGELPHYPDWKTVNIQSDGGEYYLDVNCVHCGRSGCVARLNDLATEVNW